MTDTELRFLGIAIEHMAWDDDDWTGNTLNICRMVLFDFADRDQIADKIKEDYANFIYAIGRDEIIPDDMLDRFNDDAEYQAYLDWAKSL